MKKYLIGAVVLVVAVLLFAVVTWFPSSQTVVYNGHDESKDRFQYALLSADGTCGDRETASSFEIRDAKLLGLWNSDDLRSAVSSQDRGDVLEVRLVAWRNFVFSWFPYALSYDATGENVPFC